MEGYCEEGMVIATQGGPRSRPSPGEWASSGSLKLLDPRLACVEIRALV